jgi:hypothetical protein
MGHAVGGDLRQGRGYRGLAGAAGNGGVGSRSPSCARYTIVNIRWKRTQRDFSGNLLKTASIKGSINSTPLACHKYLQHSINFISAASPPALKNGSISFIDSPKPRLSSSSTTFFLSIVRSLTAVTFVWNLKNPFNWTIPEMNGIP